MTLAAIYARVPTIACKGLCHGSCGPVPATVAEVAAVEALGGKPFAVNERLTCSMLFAGRCIAYEARPLLCRAWGVTKGMRCPHGCEPERVMTDAEARELIRQAGEVGGGYVLPELPKDG